MTDALAKPANRHLKYDKTLNRAFYLIIEHADLIFDLDKGYWS